ncbi:MAG: hypothetical protein LBE80_03230, partial [Deltaproteobacteria bacterium]|nr:hypothetical protein [Deltaproteobacteria bacterium]
MMRKLILFCLALAMVVVSVPAMAATSVDFKGSLKVYHENLYNFNRSRAGADLWRDSDSFFIYRLTLDVTLKPTEDISVYWRVRTLNWPRWGTVS